MGNSVRGELGNVGIDDARRRFAARRGGLVRDGVVGQGGLEADTGLLQPLLILQDLVGQPAVLVLEALSVATGSRAAGVAVDGRAFYVVLPAGRAPAVP